MAKIYTPKRSRIDIPLCMECETRHPADNNCPAASDGMSDETRLEILDRETYEKKYGA